MLNLANQQFRQLYNQLDKNHLNLLSNLYAEDTCFIDPFHRVEGLKALESYCAEMYANITDIQFDYGEVSFGEQLFHQDWVMTFCHPKINAGKSVSVAGCSRVQLNDEGKIIEHQDYFDAGQMLYQHLPLVGSAITFIRRRFAP